MSGLRIVVRYRRANANGHHAVLAALQHERADGYEVVFTTTPAELASAVAAAPDSQPVLVTWSFYTSELAAVEAELAAAPRRPGLVHLAGGVHASAEPHATLRLGFDAVAIGEGEHTFVSLVGALLDGGNLARVPGLLLATPPGPVSTGPAVRHPLDRYPAFPARWSRFNPIEITRGCIYACRFCQTPYMFKARFRHRSVENVGAHVAELRARGLRYVRFVTPSALSYGTQDAAPDLAAVEALLAACRREIGPDGKVYFGTFPSELRPEHVTPEALRIIRRFCDNRDLVIGAQSGSERVLASAHRGHGVAAVHEAVKTSIAEGFRPHVDLLFALPGETEDDAQQSLALARRLIAQGARIHTHTFMPLPGTPYRDAGPAPLSPAARQGIEALHSAGAAYGQWKSQERRAAAYVAPPRRRAADADADA